MKRPLLLGAFIFLLFELVFEHALYGAEYIWWEAETTAQTNFPRTTWVSGEKFGARRRDLFSAGDWLSNFGEREGEEAYAVYNVVVPAAGEYSLWARKYWKHGPFRWRFDDGDWQTCTRHIGIADNTDIRKFVNLNWVHLGKVTLDAGPHRFELRLLAEEGQHLTSGFDCFILTTGTFTPRGNLRPDELSGKAPEGWWAFEPAADTFSESPINLRSLNENVAGESGFVRREGSQFVLGNGRPVRFWAVNCGPGIIELSGEAQSYLARRLAKMGVNMVRLHGAIADHANPVNVNTDHLDDYHRFVSILKEQGIYVKLSFYFPLWYEPKAEHGIPGYDTIENKKPFSLLFFEPRMQELYFGWAKALLTTPNPYTGLPLAEDPAVAIIEVVNEDSYLFWTFQASMIPEVHRAKLERIFADWLVKRYGSLKGADAEWGAGGRRNTDDAANGRMTLMDAWFMTRQGHGGGGLRKRMENQVRFLVEHQRSFYEDTVEKFRREFGVRSLISCSNWKTADDVLLGALERYSYTAGDVIDHHLYFSSRHKGPRSRFAIDVGDTYTDHSALLNPAAAPLAVNQVTGYPHIISETGWTNPNRFRAESPVLAAAYGSLQGIDGFFFFAVNGMDWEGSTCKFPLAVPSVLGQFPATALMYRRGDISQAQPVVHEALKLEELFAFRGSAAPAEQNLDEFRKADVPPGATIQVQNVRAIDPFAYYAGRVERSFDDEHARSTITNLAEFIDREAKIIKSTTGELTWDYGNGVLKIDTPRSQGAVGFLKNAGRINLSSVSIESSNEYGSVLAVSLDGEPLATSRSILVQAVTEDRCYGWRVEDDTIKDLGVYPQNVREIDARITIANSRLNSASVLDEHGYVRSNAETERNDTDITLILPLDSLYTVLEGR